MHPAYLKARMDDVRACDERAAPATAREDRSAILGALADLGLPENSYVRDPSNPRSALYLYSTPDGRHEIACAPWRLARCAPSGMAPEDVRRVGRELLRGLLWILSGFTACLVLLVGSLAARTLVPPPPPESLTPAAYLQAAPAILGCVAALLVFAAVGYLIAFLFPRRALVEEAGSQSAFADLTDRGDRT